MTYFWKQFYKEYHLLSSWIKLKASSHTKDLVLWTSTGTALFCSSLCILLGEIKQKVYNHSNINLFLPKEDINLICHLHFYICVLSVGIDLMCFVVYTLGIEK